MGRRRRSRCRTTLKCRTTKAPISEEIAPEAASSDSSVIPLLPESPWSGLPLRLPVTSRRDKILHWFGVKTEDESGKANGKDAEHQKQNPSTTAPTVHLQRHPQQQQQQVEPQLVELLEPDSSPEDLFDDIPKIICVVSYGQSKQDSVIMCSICGNKVDQRGIKDGTESHFYFRQIGLDVLCAFDSEIVLEDEGVRCNVCYDCSAIYEDAKQMMKSIKDLEVSLKTKLAQLKNTVEESRKKGVNGAPEIVGTFCSDRVNDEKKIKNIQNKFVEAIEKQGHQVPSAQPTPAGKRGRPRKVKQENGQNVPAHPAVNIKVETETAQQKRRRNNANESQTRIPDVKPYNLRWPGKVVVKKDDLDEDWEPRQKPKRQYKKRATKRERSADEEHQREDDQRDVKRVKSQSPSKKPYCFSGEHFGGVNEWLTTHVEVAEKGLIQRATLYRHYVDWCIQQNRIPQNQASFGKMVRWVFGEFVWTRRLGPRGVSRYCYAGIRIKQSSPFNEIQEEYDVEDGDCAGPRAKIHKRWQVLGIPSIPVKQTPTNVTGLLPAFSQGIQLPMSGEFDIKSFLTGVYRSDHQLPSASGAGPIGQAQHWAVPPL